MELSVGIWRLFDTFLKMAQLKATYINCPQATEHLRKSMCEFQLHFTNYQFVSGQKHKKFKKSLENDQVNSDELFDELTIFSENGLKTLCGMIAKGIQEYFIVSRKSNERTRIGIYGANNDDDLFDIIKLGAQSLDQPKKIADYSCFSEVCKSGTPYLDNNLPKTIVRNKIVNYKHKGIDLHKVCSSYNIPFAEWKLPSRWLNNIAKKKKNDDSWHLMSAKDDASNGSLYKSHLVIPVTFRHHAQTEQLDGELINILKLRDDGRSILAFICIDHASTYFFDDKASDSFENLDINVMYIFADLLSLALVTHRMYTDGSQSYYKYSSKKQEVRCA